jgi:hypothetical protein
VRRGLHGIDVAERHGRLGREVGLGLHRRDLAALGMAASILALSSRISVQAQTPDAEDAASAPYGLGLDSASVSAIRLALKKTCNVPHRPHAVHCGFPSPVALLRHDHRSNGDAR